MKLSCYSIKAMGFTLIELMITVAILGIIATIALPSYQDYVRQTNRTVAKSILFENAQFMERFYSQNNQYDATVGADGIINTGDDIPVVPPILQSPRTGTKQYDISLQSVANNTFVLQAIPTGSMAEDVCGTLTLSNTGVQGSGGNVANCWNR
ncbi:type IV pilin protein [Nitrosomonas supralitoralis]|uniref:Type IV pilin n=1 Tax=Nitrosomonas supralitoralis TaxID=2116706 RepID=A0A2P7NWI9_9PROT|nr:type IV pilin protein [Nitrosomonas supralitoralis]PSJ17823.1 type IV pilin [Nitrosomonas supralitoralis]